MTRGVCSPMARPRAWFLRADGAAARLPRQDDDVRKPRDKLAAIDNDSGMTHGKTYGTVSADMQQEMSGLEFVQGLVDGTLPLNTMGVMT